MANCGLAFSYFRCCLRICEGLGTNVQTCSDDGAIRRSDEIERGDNLHSLDVRPEIEFKQKGNANEY